MTPQASAIRAAQKKLGWTNRDFADEMGVIERTVQRWRAGDLPRDAEKLAEIARVLAMPLELLVRPNGDDPLVKLQKELDALKRRVARLERGRR